MRILEFSTAICMLIGEQINAKYYKEKNFLINHIVRLRWVGLRLEIVGSFVILFASLVAVFKKHQISAGVAGLSISYAISVIIIFSDGLKALLIEFTKVTRFFRSLNRSYGLFGRFPSLKLF